MPNCPFCGQPIVGRSRVCGSTECIKRQYDSWMQGQITVPEGFLTAIEFAKKRGVTTQSVSKNCRTGKYTNCFQDPKSGRWYIKQDELQASTANGHGGTRIGAGREMAVTRRKARQPIKATDKEWNAIVEKAAVANLSVNEYLIRKALDKPLK